MAQLPCVDSNRIDPFYQCNDPRFEPVCGCNFKTYRNDCESFRRHGVNIIFSDGVCQNDIFFFDVYPNLVTFQTQFFLQFYDEGPVTIEIRDAFGKLNYFKIIQKTHYFQETLNLSSFKTGVYFMSVRSGPKIDFRRIIKISY
jgi:hypothetical protein